MLGQKSHTIETWGDMGTKRYVFAGVHTPCFGSDIVDVIADGATTFANATGDLFVCKAIQSKFCNPQFSVGQAPVELLVLLHRFELLVVKPDGERPFSNHCCHSSSNEV